MRRIDAALNKRETIPSPNTLNVIQYNPDYYGWVVGFVTIDPAILDDRVERANTCLPRRVLERRDTLARASHESRFGMVAARRNSNLPPFVSDNMEEGGWSGWKQMFLWNILSSHEGRAASQLGLHPAFLYAICYENKGCHFSG